MSRKPKPEEHIHLGAQNKPTPIDEVSFESLRDKLAKRQKLAESEGAKLSRRHVDALPLYNDGVTPSFVDDWKKPR